jgi:hypothetical protein
MTDEQKAVFDEADGIAGERGGEQQLFWRLQPLRQSRPNHGELGGRGVRIRLVLVGTSKEIFGRSAVPGLSCPANRPPRDAPRMALVFGEHPKLEQWSRWRLSETATVYILRGSSFFRQLLVVVDRESLDPLRLARKHVPVPPLVADRPRTLARVPGLTAATISRRSQCEHLKIAAE